MELTSAATATTTTTVDDPIKRMIWSLGPDSKTRYPKRFKMVLDGWLTKPEDGPEALRIAGTEYERLMTAWHR